MFVTEINTGTGDGWEIITNPIPRSQAREMAKWYRTHVDYEKQPNFKARAVSTGKPKEEVIIHG
jgi:hypothetical protein